MPAPGNQHSAVANPFEEPKPRVSEYTAQEIATLQSRLEKQLGPEYLSARTGPSGQKVHYIAAEKCIALANEVFGFNGWSSSIQNIQVDFVDENAQTLKISLGLSVIVRVTLRDGTFHEDIGYGHIENCKGKAAAFEKAKKEGTTDALKRALRNFGNLLGNCIYDKTYLQKVTKIKIEPAKFDEGGLHRHADYAKRGDEPKTDSSATTSATTLTKAESFEDFLGELDEADFCVDEDGRIDELCLAEPSPASNAKPDQQPPPALIHPPARALARSGSGGGNLPHPPQTPEQPNSRPGGSGGQQNNHNSRPQHPQPYNQQRPQQPQNGSHNKPAQQAAQHSPATVQNQTPGAEPVAFFSARAVPKDVGENNAAALPSAQPGFLFNPRAESPSIRKTPGIDHSTTKPLARSGQHVAPAAQKAADKPAAPGAVSRPGPPGPPAAGPPQQGGGRSNVINPQLDATRRIGAPGGGMSPMANRGFRTHLNVKRPAPDGAANRVPLTDVSNDSAAAGGNLDAKRLKTS